MKKSAEAISTLLNRVSNTSMPVSAEDQQLQNLLRGALLYCEQSGDEGSMTRTLQAFDTEKSTEGDSGSFSLDELDIKYSLDDLLEKTEGILNGDTPSDTAEQEIRNLFEQTILRSRGDSRLENYNYDMVYSITQKALNATMEEYVDMMGADREPTTKYYAAIEDYSPQGFHIEEVSGHDSHFFDSLNLFEIPARAEDRTQEQTQMLEQAAKHKLLYAFQGSFGIPEDADLSEIGNIIDLIPGQLTYSTGVIYNMYFKNLIIIELKYDAATKQIEFKKIEQTGHSPWVFRFKVNLGLIGISRNQLPEGVARHVHNMDPESMFSIQQLFLDLNTVKLQDALPIPEVSEDAANFVNEWFTQVYFEKLRDTVDEGAVVFAYALKPNDNIPSAKRYLFRPSDFRFYVSPYYEDGKENPQKRSLYTLNYILACDGRWLPMGLKEFTWNWVDESDARFVHGSMSINKQRIYDFAVTQFTDIIRTLKLVPVVKISLKDDIFRIGFSNDSSNARFHNGVFEHFAQASDADGLKVLKAIVNYACTSFINSYQSTDNKAVIECKCDIKCDLDFQVLGGSSRGHILKKTIWYTLTIDIDEYGQLILKPSVKIDDHGTSFTLNTISKILSLGTVTAAINFAKDTLTNALNDTNSFSAREFSQRYNSQAMWVLPGNRTFIFKQPRFSWDSDLTFDINYARAYN